MEHPTIHPQAPETATPLNLAGTRRAPRFKIDGIQAHVDGKAATLIDLSLVGAQLMMTNRIKPSQRVKFTLEDQGRTIRIRSTVAWACFEVVGGSARYRAGIEFVDAQEVPLQQFIDAGRKAKAKTKARAKV